MRQLIRVWFDICLWRAAPQDLPASGILLALSLGCYALVSVLVSLGSYGLAGAVQLALLDLGLLAVFVLSLLYLQDKTARIKQTLSALAGTGSLLGVFALPLVWWMQPDQQPAQAPVLLTLFWLLLLVWNLLVMAHIMRHALSSSVPVGLGVSLLYVLVSMQVIAALFPQQVV
jgi:hypothetical protein